MTFLMEKIKLSNYGKKSGKMNESFSNSHHHFYETEPVMGTENKNSKQTKKSSEQIEKIQKFR